MVKEQREEHKMKKLRVGVIGIGDISNVYLNNLKKYDIQCYIRVIRQIFDVLFSKKGD